MTQKHISLPYWFIADIEQTSHDERVAHKATKEKLSTAQAQLEGARERSAHYERRLERMQTLLQEAVELLRKLQGMNPLHNDYDGEQYDMVSNYLAKIDTKEQTK